MNFESDLIIFFGTGKQVAFRSLAKQCFLHNRPGDLHLVLQHFLRREYAVRTLNLLEVQGLDLKINTTGS